ncbi:amino acid adenylation domain-containing protein [Streptomyces sp. AM 4-1-1]|uniref:amino acid adenylation domain-containing protein n=1 Tax=Streptomyces sp. AM 4-1-1 TaxID=3028710 RepID=UPI0023B8A456|nr:amino acid adenylation domain-containing protein [Streptomyces sp. AM 4-1-1]WEH34009.1 amino acid adenylation domain-containing protein [Streptomyces sp. AM 4-1-1]
MSGTTSGTTGGTTHTHGTGGAEGAGGGPALTLGQERLWFLDQLDPADASYNIPLVLGLTGALSVDALRAAFDGTVARHEALRTRFPAVDGRPVAVVEPPASVPLEVVDLREWPESAVRAEADRLLAERTNAGFDLAHGPLLRVTLLRVANDEHLLCVVLHHIVADGWSLNLLRDELATRYAAHRAGRPVELPAPLPYTVHAAREREFARGPEADASLAHWRERLAGAPVLDLRPSVDGSDGDRYGTEGAGSARGAFHTRRLVGAGADVDALARERRCTPFMVLLAAYQSLLHRYTGQDDFCVGVPAAGRGEPELEELIGYFSTTLVLRAELEGGPAFGELLKRVRRSALAGFSHDRVPFERLIDELGIERRLGSSPLFQTLLTVHTQDEGAGGERQFADLRCADADGGHAASKFELMLDIRREGADLVAVLGYRTDLFDARWADRFARHFETLLRGALAAPDSPVPELPLLSDEERAELLALGTGDGFEGARGRSYTEDGGGGKGGGGGGGGGYGVRGALPGELARVAEVFGSAVAVSEPGGEPTHRELTYRELWDAAGALAVRLRAAGVRRGDVVGVALPRGASAVTAMLGAWRAGAAYLPLDLEYPGPRLEFMVTDTGVRVVVADLSPGGEAGGERGEPAGELSWLPGGTVVVTPLDTVGGGSSAGAGDGRQACDPDWLAGPDDTAYIIHTSGSTGTPKGVVVPHRALAARVEWMRRAYGITSEDRVLQFASLSFDTHAEEVFPALTAGARLVVAGAGSTLPDQFAAGHGDGLTVLDLPTPYWHQLVDELDTVAWPPGLRLLILGADQVRPDAVATWRERFGDSVQIINSYGPTETTVIATAARLGKADTDRRPPIGGPLSRTTVTVCDAHGRLLPRGVAGELLVGGDGVTYGYGGRPGATARAFVPDPNGPPGARRYRTGDLARWREDGQLEFLGRLDAQIKVRGHRVEPGEVEAALLARPGVGQAVVVVRDEALIGYVVPASGAGPSTGLSPAELRAGLAATLPGYLVPNSLVVLDALPLTPNGKLDRHALPAPEQRPDLGAGYVAPRTDAEDLVVTAWAEVLGLDRVGALDDFFDLGGHSLLATRVIARIRSAVDLAVPLRALFVHRTAEAFAVAVEDLLLAEIEAMSEEDAEERLAAETGPERNGTTA